MQDTFIGGALARLPPSLPTNVLNGLGSATFALNAAANGSATAVVTGNGFFWTNIEQPILNFFRTAVTVISEVPLIPP
jgi:hypothetical protein